MIKECPTCWGKRKVCVALNEDLSPILEDCRDCGGKGWIETKDWHNIKEGKLK